MFLLGTLFSLVASRDTLYLSLMGSVRMLPLLPNLRVLDRAIPVQEVNGEVKIRVKCDGTS